MATIYCSYRPRTHVGGTGTIELDESELNPASQQVLKGMAPHIASVMEHAWAVFEMVPGDFDGLNNLLQKTHDRSQEHGSAIRQMTDETGASAVAVLSDFVAVSALLSRFSIEALENCDYGPAVSLHSLSVSILARFSVLLDLECTSGGTPATGAAHALSCRADQIIKPEWKTFVRRVIESGAHKKIKTIDDLLNTPGYNPLALKIQLPTLKKWAGEEGMKFQPGRPKRKI